jgi:hypothetical protein
MIIIDDFLKDKELLERCRSKEAWNILARKAEVQSENMKVYDLVHGTPATVWEEIIELIYNDSRLELKKFKPKTAEFWGNVLSRTNQLDWHKDKNERLLVEKNIMVHPQIGVIWYPKEHEIVGGYLEIDRKDYAQSFERIQPVPNRIIVFNPSTFHRVSKILSGTRYGFQLNLW